MKILFKGKDGGEESKVYGYWLFESKRFGSIVLLNFKEGSRQAFHTHAFDSISWVLYGSLREKLLYGNNDIIHNNSFKPIFTYRDTFHKVSGICKNNWVMSFRGSWVNTWLEYLPKVGKFITLTNGRKQV